MKIYNMKIEDIFDQNNRFYYKRSMSYTMAHRLDVWWWQNNYHGVFVTFIAEGNKILSIQLYTRNRNSWNSLYTYTLKNYRRKGLASKIWKRSIKINKNQPDDTYVISKAGLGLVRSLKIKNVFGNVYC